MIALALLGVGGLALALIPFHTSVEIDWETGGPSGVAVASKTCDPPIVEIISESGSSGFHFTSGARPPAGYTVPDASRSRVFDGLLHGCGHKAVPRVAIVGGILFLVLAGIAVAIAAMRRPGSVLTRSVSDRGARS